MSKTTRPLKPPPSLKKEVGSSQQNDESLNQWIATAITQNVVVVETTAEFLKHRAGNASGSGLLDILRQTPDRTPDPGDELPPIGFHREDVSIVHLSNPVT